MYFRVPVSPVSRQRYVEEKHCTHVDLPLAQCRKC